jgi:hypothetical protein
MKSRSIEFTDLTTHHASIDEVCQIDSSSLPGDVEPRWLESVFVRAEKYLQCQVGSRPFNGTRPSRYVKICHLQV